jgi:hypothetical protein
MDESEGVGHGADFGLEHGLAHVFFGKKGDGRTSHHQDEEDEDDDLGTE